MPLPRRPAPKRERSTAALPGQQPANSHCCIAHMHLGLLPSPLLSGPSHSLLPNPTSPCSTALPLPACPQPLFSGPYPSHAPTPTCEPSTSHSSDTRCGACGTCSATCSTTSSSPSLRQRPPERGQGDQLQGSTCGRQVRHRAPQKCLCSPIPTDACNASHRASTAAVSTANPRSCIYRPPRTCLQAARRCRPPAAPPRRPPPPPAAAAGCGRPGTAARPEVAPALQQQLKDGLCNQCWVSVGASP